MTEFTAGGMVGTRIYLSWAAGIYANADSSPRLEGGTVGYDDAGEDACAPRDIMANKMSAPPQKKDKDQGWRSIRVACAASAANTPAP